ncbi:predicted protein [Sclerotinia sclerotiorum 1980 UF-70]|uniref:Uncharacterized protein n=1 Tax=Sclerotinia sclerotiorum (strain ATCC 18683 / 1980 / Ss-1) TaxID=665079 RepID=A7EPE8_SCLS1|nr:predicted protein [Sclerotinia sclerotiorum 1980 UF-70]EDO04714.1 predicted protein [Sclerotinia sclerotiorum 1980 UF-70]
MGGMSFMSAPVQTMMQEILTISRDFGFDVSARHLVQFVELSCLECRSEVKED